MKSNLPLSLKRKVYNECILPFLTYISETWSLTKGMKTLKCPKGNGEREIQVLGSRPKLKTS